MCGETCRKPSPASIDQLLTLSEASHRLPGRPSLPTVWRWCTAGCRGIRLEAVRLGRRWCVTPEALHAFGAALAEQSRAELADKRPAPTATGTATTPRPSDARRAREVEAAKENLRREGVLR